MQGKSSNKIPKHSNSLVGSADPPPRLLGALGGMLGLTILVLLPAAFFCPGSFWLAMKVSALSGFLVGFVWPNIGMFGMLVFGILGQGL